MTDVTKRKTSKSKRKPKRRPARGTYEDLLRFAKGRPGDSKDLMLGYYIARGKTPPAEE